MKRWSFLVIAAVIVGIVGCGNSSPNSPEAKAKGEEANKQFQKEQDDLMKKGM
jgi:predicted small lipoprotein YifL